MGSKFITLRSKIVFFLAATFLFFWTARSGQQEIIYNLYSN
jgi:nitrogen fixation-related uncharacterized protein